MSYITSDTESLVYKGLIYNSEFNILICLSCKTAIGNTESVIKHFINNHLDSYSKEEINYYLKNAIKDLIITNFKDIKNPEPYKYYFNYLKSYTGIICLKCDFATIHIKALKQHLNNEHNIKDTYKENNNYLNTYSKSNMNLQTFFINKKYLKYFITNKNKNMNNDTEDYITLYNNKLDKLLKAQLINNKPFISKETTSFLDNSKFLVYLQNKSKDRILQELRLIETPLLNKELNIYKLAYNITYNLVIKLESKISLLSRHYQQLLNTENLDESRKEMRNFKALNNKEYNKTFPLIIICIIKLFLSEEYQNNINTYQPKLIDYETKIEVIIKDLNELYNININKEVNTDLILNIENNIIILFFYLLNQDIKQSDININYNFNSPIITWLLLSSLKSNITFKEFFCNFF